MGLNFYKYHPVKVKKKPPKKTYRITRRGWMALGILLVLGLGLIWSQFLRSQKAYFPERIGQIPVVTQLVPDDYRGRPGYHRRIQWIVIHETANQAAGANAKAHSDYLKSEKQADIAKSWHYTVDKELIYHHLPDNEVGWHAGDGMTPGGGNQGGIGIEICVNQDGDYPQAVANATQLVAYLLDVYDLPISAVKQHHDFMNKDCPHFLRQDNNWETFLEQVAITLQTYQ